ncbi:MAG: hypothetical protein WC365_01035 [Candidatus Babeliales bacterium]
MKVGEYMRTLIKSVKEERGIDLDFQEKRVIGIGYKYYLKAWTDPDAPKYLRFIISDESFATYKEGVLEGYIKSKVDELIGEFL